jgi:uncharacterized protein
MDARISVVPVTWQDGANVIVGQSHFIKSVEDIVEIMASTVPGAKCGLAFCKASGPCLIRTEGNDPALIADAVRAAEAAAARCCSRPRLIPESRDCAPGLSLVRSHLEM